MLAEIAHIQTRRIALRARFDVRRQMRAIEETCIPSYLHPNVAAAGVAWMRLFTAARIFRDRAPKGPVLDFGAQLPTNSHTSCRRGSSTSSSKWTRRWQPRSRWTTPRLSGAGSRC